MQDANGEMVPGWPTFATVWAEVEDISGREYVVAGSTQNSVTTTMTIRYRAGVIQNMRVMMGAVPYNIEAVLGQDKKELLLMCSRGVNNG